MSGGDGVSRFELAWVGASESGTAAQPVGRSSPRPGAPAGGQCSVCLCVWGRLWLGCVWQQPNRARGGSKKGRWKLATRLTLGHPSVIIGHRPRPRLQAHIIDRCGCMGCVPPRLHLSIHRPPSRSTESQLLRCPLRIGLLSYRPRRRASTNTLDPRPHQHHPTAQSHTPQTNRHTQEPNNQAPQPWQPHLPHPHRQP